MLIPDKLTNFIGYDDSDIMIGTVDVALPNLAFITEALSGAGIAGEIDMPTIGHLQSLVLGINWRSLVEDNIKLLAPITKQLTLKGSLQLYDKVAGELVEQALRIVTKAMPKGVNLGNLNPATGMGTSGEFELSYIKIAINGRDMVEVDKLNFKYIVDGVDYLEETRRNMGLS